MFHMPARLDERRFTPVVDMIGPERARIQRIDLGLADGDQPNPSCARLRPRQHSTATHNAVNLNVYVQIMSRFTLF